MPGKATDVRLEPTREMVEWIEHEFTWLKSQTWQSAMAKNLAADLCAWCAWRLTGRAPAGDQGDENQEFFDFAGENDAPG